MEIGQRNRILTDLASQKRFLGYDELINALGLADQRLLEDFLINAIYEGVIQGQLNPRKRELEVKNWSVTRSVANEEIPVMIETLENWISHGKEIMLDLNKEIERSNEQLKSNKEKEKTIEEKAAELRRALESGQGPRSGSLTQEPKSSTKEVKRHKGLKKRPGPGGQ